VGLLPAAEVFGAGWGQRVTTEDEFDECLASARASNEGPILIEIVLDRLDSCETLKRLCAELSPEKGQAVSTNVSGGNIKRRSAASRHA
jgi:TPP-dependent 2-oxoacid decarboxylase